MISQWELFNAQIPMVLHFPPLFMFCVLSYDPALAEVTVYSCTAYSIHCKGTTGENAVHQIIRFTLKA